MSKQVAVLLDNSGSMFHPIGGGNPNTKIYETARGAEFFIENLLDELAANPGSDFAISVHRFASSYQVLLGGAQIDSSQVNFATALAAMQGSIAAIENQAASQAAVGNLTDLYDAVRRVSDHLNNGANQPGFGAPDTKVIFLFTDGLQTIDHNGVRTMAGYEAEQGVTFENLLQGRGIKLVAWGSGSDALGEVLAELADRAVQGGTNPVSDSKVLFPIDESGTFENCTTIIATNAIQIVSNNGVLPLAPAGQPPSGLLWEQFSLPTAAPLPPGEIVTAVLAPQQVNFRDFDVLADGSTRELILALVSHARRGEPSLQATSPSGTVFTTASVGTRSFQVANAWALKIPKPEEGTWRVRVHGDPKRLPLVLDLMARGVLKQFSLEAKAKPRQISEPGKVEVRAWPRWDGEPAEGKLEVVGRILGGGSFPLERQDDGSFAGIAEISRPGISIIAVAVAGTLKATRASIRRVAFTVVLLGRATDPRFLVQPDTYEQGGEYTVALHLVDARFRRSTQIRFGDGIQVLDFEMWNDTTASARIRVAADAFVGERIPVSYHPQAESVGPVRVVEAKDRPKIPGRICCLRFDAAGRLVAIVLCDGKEVCVKIHDERLEKLLELARDRNLSVEVHVDEHGCLTGIDICR